MSREKQGYRENLALLNARFPDKDMLNARDVQSVYGCCLATVYRKIPINKDTHRISKAKLASCMCD